MRVFKLLIVLSALVRTTTVADQKNASKVEMPTLDDPCNVGGAIYSDCKEQTQGKSYYDFSDCMQKVGIYSNRNGDLCCPSTDPSKEYYDCEPTPAPVPEFAQDKRALYIASTVGPVATILGCVAAICCWKNRKRLDNTLTQRAYRAGGAVGGHANDNSSITAPLASSAVNIYSESKRMRSEERPAVVVEESVLGSFVG